MPGMHADVVQWVKALKHAGVPDELVVRTLLSLESAPSTASTSTALVQERSPLPVQAPSDLPATETALPPSVLTRGHAQVKLTLADGTRGNVIVPVALMAALVRRHGSVRQAYRHVRAVAQRAGLPTRGRSQRICEMLQAELQPGSLF